jgi:transcriptional regulator with GAF, ATPase, and Fis domain
LPKTGIAGILMSTDGQMINCTHCGESIQAAAIFCRFCFSGLSPRHFRACPSCAEIIRKDAEICRFCNSDLPPYAIPEMEEKSPEEEAKMLTQFRVTFLAEIDNLMTYCEKPGDALFMIVNIIGKALQASRCLTYCTDRARAVWTYAEYWDRDTVKGCRELNWRASKSILVARTVLAQEPLILQRHKNSHSGTPMQDEFDLLEIESLMGVPLGGQQSSQGCLILQQCDCHRDWTSDEIEWIETVGATLARSLAAHENTDTEPD